MVKKRKLMSEIDRLEDKLDGLTAALHDAAFDLRKVDGKLAERIAALEIAMRGTIRVTGDGR